MLKRTVKYVDFDGNEREETLYFNLNEVEAVRLDAEMGGDLEGYIERLDPEARPQDVMFLFERLLYLSYGEKSEDGRHFIKSEESATLFKNSAVYSALFMELISDADEAVSFFNNVLTTTMPAPKS